MFNAHIKVLVVEDNPGDYFLVKEYLEETMVEVTVLHADTLARARMLLEDEKPDVVLLDLTLPDGMGLDSFHGIYTNASNNARYSMYSGPLP